MNNNDSIERLIEELKEDEETVIMKEDSELSKKDETALIQCLKRRANLFDKNGFYLDYDVWKNIFFDVADMITYTNYKEDGRIENRPSHFMDDSVNRSIIDNATDKLPYDLLGSLSEEKTSGKTK